MAELEFLVKLLLFSLVVICGLAMFIMLRQAQLNTAIAKEIRQLQHLVYMHELRLRDLDGIADDGEGGPLAMIANDWPTEKQ